MTKSSFGTMQGFVWSAILVVVSFVTPQLEAASRIGNFTDISQQHSSLHDRIRNPLTTDSIPTINGQMEINNHLGNVCQEPFTMFGEYCLYFDYYTWGNHSTAASTCASLGATLAYPTGDLAQWQAAIADAITTAVDYWEPWVGATRDQTSDTWLWVTGTVVPPGAWIPGYPKGWGDCAVAYWEDGRLGDVSCSNLYSLLCQVEILECYSCFKCPDVDSNTNVVDAGSHSCFTSLYVNEDVVNRGIAAELHIDGECEFIDGATVCYCNTQLCNG